MGQVIDASARQLYREYQFARLAGTPERTDDGWTVSYHFRDHAQAEAFIASVLEVASAVRQDIDQQLEEAEMITGEIQRRKAYREKFEDCPINRIMLGPEETIETQFHETYYASHLGQELLEKSSAVTRLEIEQGASWDDSAMAEILKQLRKPSVEPALLRRNEVFEQVRQFGSPRYSFDGWRITNCCKTIPVFDALKTSHVCNNIKCNYCGEHVTVSEQNIEREVTKFGKTRLCKVIPNGVPLDKYADNQVIWIERAEDMYGVDKLKPPFCLLHREDWLKGEDIPCGDEK